MNAIAYAFRRLNFTLASVLISSVVGCSSENPAPAQAPNVATGGNSASTTETTSAVAPGDVDLSKLPVPPDAKTTFANADVAMYVVETSPGTTKEACRKLLVAQGWSPYGSAGDAQFFKRNLVRVTAHITAAPAQGGKTMISFSKERLTVDLPAPTDVEGLQYSDSTKTLFFDTKASRDDVANYFRTELAKAQWEATTEKPIEIEPKFVLIFRNPAKDLLTLEMQDFEGKTRTTLRHESAEQVAQSEEAFKKEMARLEAERNKPLPKVTVAIPAEAKELDQKKNRIEFQVPNGTAKAVVDGWRKTYVAAGWTEKVITADNMVGTIHFDKDGQSLSLSYTDTGFIPAEVSISAIGAELTAETK